MQRTKGWGCRLCLKAIRPDRFRAGVSNQATNFISTSSPCPYQQNVKDETCGDADSKEEGAMSRRLLEMTERAIESGGRRGRHAVEDAGFSDKLKKQMEERIAKTSFRGQNQQAISVVEAPSYVGAGTKAQAGAEPWRGAESLHDSALRMLDDSHKRIKEPGRAPRIPPSANLRPNSKGNPTSTGQRLANARDRTSIYTLTQEHMSEKEKEQYRKELKERFAPSGRTGPMTITGIQSLANERIEDAIARGQFKNISRGKGINVERDYNANSPFLDTTEYFMNKIIQKQEIVPPWIEKQQELVKEAQIFRNQLRNEWRRHAARVISSKGGTIADQVRRAKSYALAEAQLNPPSVKGEAVSQIDSQGNLIGSVVIDLQPQIPPDEVSRPNPPALEAVDSPTITVQTEPPSAVASEGTDALGLAAKSEAKSTPRSLSDRTVRPTTSLFRDPEWESLESAYHNLAIQNLNSLARSYNLMAPKIAQKPYYSLDRELRRCYADVAPLLPKEIEERARAPKIRVEVMGHRQGGVMERFGASEKVKVYDERKEKAYGFKEFWNDLWTSSDAKV